MTQIVCALFDLDGVLRHWAPDHTDAIERSHGLPPGTIAPAAFQDQLLRDLVTGRICRAQWVERIGVAIAHPQAAAAWAGDAGAVDDAMIGLVHELRGAGMITAVLTNGTDTIPDELRVLGIADAFHAVFNSAVIGIAKPEAGAYLHVLDQLGLQPGQVLFTDDRQENVAAAAALGMRAVLHTTAAALRAELLPA